MEVLNNFLKTGPLDNYRKLATFDWKKLRIAIETEEVIRYKNTVLNTLKSDPIFHPVSESLSLQELRKLNYLRCRRFNQINEIDLMDVVTNLRKQVAFFETLLEYDVAFCGKIMLSKLMFAAFLLKLGSKQQYEILIKIVNDEYMGCFCMTEIGHGSNTKAMRTTATYSPATKTFVLNTPNFDAAKCWSGNLGQTATHALVFAQLYTPDGVCHGVHQFVVQIRNENTLLPFAGVIIGDMGAKVGLNGLDNGFMMFRNFHVDKSCLLNKYAKISEDGVYVRQDDAKPFAASLETMSIQRLTILIHTNTSLIKAISIALRYAAIRRQFWRKEDDDEELPILEYPLHQYRLIPYLACAYVFKIFFWQMYLQVQDIQKTKPKHIDRSKYGYEVHAVSCAAKAEISWISLAGVQECREACGGHGFLKAAGIGSIRNFLDSCCTYEGDNNVIIQQTNNWLLKLWQLVLENKPIDFPLGTVNFLNNSKAILMNRFDERGDITTVEEINKMYEWLVVYLLKNTHERLMTLQNIKGNEFDAKNEIVAFYGKPLVKVYIHCFMLKIFQSFMSKMQDLPIKNVLGKLHAVYALFIVEKFSAFLYQGGYLKTFKLQNTIQQLCGELKTEVISLVDAVAPDDWLINSILGKSDGNVYKHMETALYYQQAFERPECWKQIVANAKL